MTLATSSAIAIFTSRPRALQSCNSTTAFLRHDRQMEIPADEWIIDWKTVDTRSDLLLLLVTQLTPQVAIALNSGRAIIDTDTDRMRNISSFLASVGTVSNFLWTKDSRRKSVRNAFPMRGRDLRHVLGLPDQEPENLVAIRNDLTHIDERIEELFLEDRTPSLLIWGTGLPTSGQRVLMNYNAETTTIQSLTSSIEVANLVNWLDTLHTHAWEEYLCPCFGTLALRPNNERPRRGDARRRLPRATRAPKR